MSVGAGVILVEPLEHGTGTIRAVVVLVVAVVVAVVEVPVVITVMMDVAFRAVMRMRRHRRVVRMRREIGDATVPVTRQVDREPQGMRPHEADGQRDTTRGQPRAVGSRIGNRCARHHAEIVAHTVGGGSIVAGPDLERAEGER